MEIKHSLNACLSGRQGYQPTKKIHKTNTGGFVLEGMAGMMENNKYLCGIMKRQK